MLCFPLATEIGIFIVYFLDYVVGSGWFAIILYLIFLFVVFVIRGRPYSGENIVTVLFGDKNSSSSNYYGCLGLLAPILVFLWNVVSDHEICEREK